MSKDDTADKIKKIGRLSEAALKSFENPEVKHTNYVHRENKIRKDRLNEERQQERMEEEKSRPFIERRQKNISGSTVPAPAPRKSKSEPAIVSKISDKRPIDDKTFCVDGKIREDTLNEERQEEWKEKEEPPRQKNISDRTTIPGRPLIPALRNFTERKLGPAIVSKFVDECPVDKDESRQVIAPSQNNISDGTIPGKPLIPTLRNFTKIRSELETVLTIPNKRHVDDKTFCADGKIREDTLNEERQEEWMEEEEPPRQKNMSDNTTIPGRPLIPALRNFTKRKSGPAIVSKFVDECPVDKEESRQVIAPSQNNISDDTIPGKPLIPTLRNFTKIRSELETVLTIPNKRHVDDKTFCADGKIRENPLNEKRQEEWMEKEESPRQTGMSDSTIVPGRPLTTALRNFTRSSTEPEILSMIADKKAADDRTSPVDQNRRLNVAAALNRKRMNSEIIRKMYKSADS